MHFFDKPQNACGFLYFKRSGIKTNFDISEGALRGLLTVQSIRSALTLGILLVLLRERENLLGEVVIDVASFSGTPEIMFFVLAVVGLSGSVLTTLAAIQSYDYALRFDWGQEKKKVKEGFVEKAHHLGVIGFYCLIWSLVASTHLFGPLIGQVATSVVFVLLWYYYYFPPEKMKSRAELAVENLPANARNEPVPNSKLMIPFGKQKGEMVTLAEQWSAIREGLDVLENLLPEWAKSDVKTTKEIGERIVNREA